MQVESGVRVADPAHVVQFYDADDELVGTVAGYLSRAVLDDDNVIVIATPAHRTAFLAAMRAAGVDVDPARAEGRLVLLDAADTLSQLMVGDRPDIAAFDAVIGELVRTKSRRGHQVRAYGEMVAVLWEAGHVEGAIELEKLWNDLGEQLPFSLFCAYPVRLVGARQADRTFAEVCQLHTEVVAGAPRLPRSEAMRRFPATPDALRSARRFVADTLRDWAMPGVVDDMLLVAAELAANAVQHAGADFTVGLSRDAGRIRLEVGDALTDPPARRDPDASTPGGRGLRVVEAIAGRWGHSPVEGGKIVWVELTAPTSSADDAQRAR